MISDNTKHNQITTTNTGWPAEQDLLIETITPPLPSHNDEYTSSLNDYQNHNSVIIITTHMYSNSPFISYIYNCLSNHFHPKIVSIDYLTNYHHPNTFKIFYLICFDRFDSIMKQILDSTILNNLNAHVNYLFLIINAPSYEIVKHFYSTIIDKQTILILHYHLTFDNEPLLLCSGNRKTFEIIQSSLLKYLCSKIKYIQSIENDHEQLYSAYCISSIIQSTNVLNYFVNKQIQQTLNENFDLDFLKSNQNVIDELFPQLSRSRISNENNLIELIHHSNEDILTNKSKQLTMMKDLFQNGVIKTHTPPPICEYYLQNILHEE